MRRLEARATISSETGVVSAHACRNVGLILICTTSATLFGISKACNQKGLRVGTAFEVRLTSISERSCSSLAYISTRRRSGKQGAILERTLAG